MTPGPVSDSYDPEFGTGSNAHDVKDAISEALGFVGGVLDDAPVKNIVVVAQGPPGPLKPAQFSERTLRLIRFSMNRALESI